MPGLRYFCVFLMACGCWLPSSAYAQKRPRPLIVELKQKSLLTFPADRKEIATAVRRGGNMLFVPVEINGQKAGFFLVDTGAAVSLIDTQLAHKLKLPVIGTGAASGVGGKQDAKAVQVDQLAIGEGDAKIAIGKHVAMSSDLDAWRIAFGEEFGGLLGATVWGQGPFTIDYRARQLVFHNRAHFTPPLNAKGERLYFHGGHPAVLGTINDNFSGPVILDTGHEYSLDVDTEFVAQHPELFDRATSLAGNAVGIGGKSERWATNLKSLSILGRRIDDVLVTFGRANDEPAKPDPDVITPFPAAKGLGLLGGRELRNYKLTLDYFYERIYVEHVPDDPLVDAQGNRADANAPDSLGIAPLLLAVRNRDVPAVKALLAAGANPNTAAREGYTPLVMAVNFDHSELTKLLLAAGARGNFLFSNGATLVHASAERGKLAALEELLAAGVNGNQKAKNGTSPLMLAARKGQVAAVEKLLAHKVDVNAADDARQSALHYAVDGGSAAVVTALLKGGADVRLKNRTGFDPIGMARAVKKVELAELMERMAVAKP